MKKFLIFLVSLVVVVCVGLTTYYFVRNNEVITIKTKEIYCNAGDTIPLKSLGISIKNANISKKTKFDYNAGGEDVTKYIEYNSQLDSFVVSNENAGDVVLVISTTNKKYADFTINVHIGNGSTENPYYVFNEADLEKIGSIYRLDKNYRLMNDITLTSAFQPIGYNDVTSSWNGFSGTFNGQNHTISGLNVNNLSIKDAGLFSSINAGAKVHNLTVDSATIVGEFENAGVLAGKILGTVEQVGVKNSSVTNKADASTLGAFAGYQSQGNISMSYAKNVDLTIGDDSISVTGATSGGFIGKVDQGTISACYTDGVEINNINNSLDLSGGFVGEFVIGNETGSIQQSYANTTSNSSNYGAFISKISVATGFNKAEANVLRFLIGNIAVVSNKNAADIVDTDVVKTFDNTFFKNLTYSNRSVFYEKDSAMYLVRGFANAGEIIDTNEYIFYGVDAANLTEWDTTYIWSVEGNSLPTLRMGSIHPTGPSSEYLRRDLLQKDLNNKQAFLDIFKSDIKDENIKLLEDVDLTENWTPIALTNTTFDGNNKTIKVTLKNAVSGNLGLFSVIDNCTIKNLNIIVKECSADATNVGALAGIIKSSNSVTTSTIENVTVNFQNIKSNTITNFGGIAGQIEKTKISNVSIYNLVMNSNAAVTTAGGIVGVNNGTIEKSTSSATIYGTSNVGGFAGINNGTITDLTGSPKVNYAKTISGALVGGIAGYNKGTISSSNIATDIKISNVGANIYVGGVAGDNDGTITDVVLNDGKIEVGNLAGKIYIGGVVGINDGSISNVNNKLAQVGTYNVDRQQYVGGVAAINNASISKVVAQSDLDGNIVAGIVAVMNNSKATVDQVVVGRYDKSQKVLTTNYVQGDKYLAGVVVEFKAGTITNIQCASSIIGKANATRTSLVTLIFPYGATLKNATISSGMAGYGTFYRETWTDFSSYNNKNEFGYIDDSTGDARFNLYKNDTHHGCMQSVVIDGSKYGVDDAIASMGNAFAWGAVNSYQNSEESSFIKVVDGFNDASQFQGSFEFVCSKTEWLGSEVKATKTLTFEIGKIWESNNGISLIFLNSIK